LEITAASAPKRESIWDRFSSPLSLVINAEHLIDGTPKASDGLGDRGSSVALLVQVEDIVVVERHRPALVDASGLSGFGPGPLQPSPGPSGSSYRPGPWSNLRFEYPEMRSLALQLVNKVEDIACAAAESIELDDDQCVTGTDEVQDGGQFGG
jgi:hypothetical protein